MRKLLLALAAGALLAGCVYVNINDGTLSGDESGVPLTRTYALGGDYSELAVGQHFHVAMSDTVGEPTVTLDSAMHSRLVFRIEGKRLRIGLKGSHSVQTGRATVLLPHNGRLREVELGDTSHFTSALPLTADRVSIDLSGASSFSGDIRSSKHVEIETSGTSHCEGSIQEVGTLEIDLSGASSVTLSGSVYRLEADLSGTSHLTAGDLDATHVESDLSGASSAEVLCCESIKADASGTSHLTYGTVGGGCDPHLRINTSGASSVSRR
ncbi:MAG: DUF2807 domain-containing protein [Bacteroidales bacterium]|nr:DUF2807 domain-containing protein [Bacteroidales bacterium]